MRIGTAVALCALILPATALAKGPTEATISGPGLGEPLQLGGANALAPGAPLEVLTNRGGFFQVAWGGSPGRILKKSPTNDLGPKYRVLYVVPGPSGSENRVTQELYPFARGGPLTYTPAGQPFFDTRRTKGGWFQAAPQLTTTLVAAGLPERPRHTPSAAGDDGAAPASGLWALVATLVLAGIAVLALRRRARPAAV